MGMGKLFLDRMFKTLIGTFGVFFVFSCHCAIAHILTAYNLPHILVPTIGESPLE